MSLTAALLPEYDAEMASTRKVLERIPDDRLAWRAHPKSNTIGWVADHVANIPSWVAMILGSDSFDYAPVDGPRFQTPSHDNVRALLESFDQNVAAGRAALAAARDEDLAKPWSLLEGGKVMMTMPKGAVLRSFVMNHLIHHRAFLCCYLRLNDLPVPGMYGPSGDE
jgi:uncharacterized damage-inducible protein DinB